MRDQLAKFGVECREFDDGIEVDGKPAATLNPPKDGVYCYDDHRVAMSFSVLSIAAPSPVLISERECVGKTWPGWWDVPASGFPRPVTDRRTYASTAARGGSMSPASGDSKHPPAARLLGSGHQPATIATLRPQGPRP